MAMATRTRSPQKQQHWSNLVACKNVFEESTIASNSEIGLSTLTKMCLQVACESRESVQIWRRQKRTTERLPAHLAQPLFHRLLQAGLLIAPLLELFQESIEEVDVSGEAKVDAEWTSYFANFRCLRALEAADCKSISDFAILQLKGMDTLHELNISRCARVTDEGLVHIASLSNLKKLGISETGVTDAAINSLSALTSLSYVDLGGLPVTDSAVFSLLSLHGLQHLVLWGSRVSDEGAMALGKFSHLKHLNLAWTTVTRVPPLYVLRHLNMAYCKVSSIFKDWDAVEAPLQELNLSGVNTEDSSTVLSGQWMYNVTTLDLSSSNLTYFEVLSEIRSLELLNLSGTMPQESAMQIIADIGHNLKQLNLSGVKVTSKCVGVLAGHVPKLEQISLNSTLIDDTVFPFLQLMPALKIVDLSSTTIKGFHYLPGERGSKSSSFLAMQNLQSLRTLNLRNTPMSDKACRGLRTLFNLTGLFLRSDSLSDASLLTLGLLENLTVLGIEAAILTDSGLQSFRPPPQLKDLILSDCWLLTAKGLLQFCEAHRQLQVSHHLLSNYPAPFRGIFTKEAKISPSSSKMTGESKAISRSDAQRGNQQQCKVGFSDERIKYTRKCLLDLRQSSSNKMHLISANLRSVPAILLETEELNHSAIKKDDAL